MNRWIVNVDGAETQSFMAGLSTIAASAKVTGQAPPSYGNSVVFEVDGVPIQEPPKANDQDDGGPIAWTRRGPALDFLDCSRLFRINVDGSETELLGDGIAFRSGESYRTE